jgi:hypothetical protein
MVVLTFAFLGLAAPSFAVEIEGSEKFREGMWSRTPAPPFAPAGIAGFPDSGPLIYGGNGRQVAWMANYRKSGWNVMPDAPFPIAGIAGTVDDGPLVFAGSRVAHAKKVKKPAWVQLPPAPFAIGVLTGDGKKGPVVISRDGTRVSYLKLDELKKGWRTTTTPFAVRVAAGRIKEGVVVGAGRRLARLKDFDKSWEMLPQAPGDIVSLGGGDDGGIAALFANGQIAFDRKYKGAWEVLPAPGVRVAAIGGRGKQGFLVYGEPLARKPLPPPPPPPPPADTQRPMVQIVEPAAGLCAVDTVRVRVRANDDRGVAGVRVNGVNAQLDRGGIWNAMIRLQPGANTIVAEAWDVAGNRSRANVSLHADWSPPQVQARAVATVTVRGRVDDPTASVTVDGAAVQMNSDGTFAIQVRAPTSGFVTLVAVDRAGNRTESRIPVK